MRRHTARICLLLCLLIAGQGAFAVEVNAACCHETEMMPDCPMSASAHDTAKAHCGHGNLCACSMMQVQMALPLIAALNVVPMPVEMAARPLSPLPARRPAPLLRPPIALFV